MAADLDISVQPLLVGEQNFVSQAGRAGALAGETFVRKFQQPLGRITGTASEFEKSMAASNARVLAFTASAGGLYAIANAFKKLVESTILVEKELANINLYMNLGSNSLKQFSSNLFSIATKTATPFQDAAKAAMEFSRQGLTMNEVLKRTSDALSLSRLTGMGMEDAISDLTSIMNSFNKESLNTTMIVDRLSSVGGKFAVSADAIAEALKRVGSSASDAGVHFDEMIALITSTQHITGRAASVIGTSFNTIFARLQRPKVLEDLESVGVQIRNTSGSMLPMMDIIKNLSTRYEQLSVSQKSFISETVGGVRQLNTLKALFNDLGGGYSIYGRAMDAAANSTGIAQKRISSLNETISASLQQTSTSWQEFLSNVGNLTVGPIIKGGAKGLTQVGQGFAQATNPNALNSQSGLDRTGADLAQGAFKSIGNILSGPGLQVGASVLYKLFDKLTTFAVNSSRELMGINKIAKDRATIEEFVSRELAKQPNLLNGVINKEQEILRLLQEQSILRERNNLISQSVSGGLIRMGQSSSAAGMINGAKIPSLSIVNDVGSGLSKEFNLIKGPKAWNQSEANCFNIASNLAEKYGFVSPTMEQTNNTIMMNRAKKMGWGMLEDQIYYGPKNSSGNMVIREGNEPWLVHTSFEFKNKEFNYGPTTKEGYKITHRIPLKKSSNHSSIQEAIKAENKATKGHATLSSSPYLVSDSNPLGLAAIDTRTQKNATEAVNQHIALGQSLNDIKSGNTSKVPGLAIDSTLMATALMGLGSGMKGTHETDFTILGLKRNFGLLNDSLEKQIYTVTKLSKVQDELAMGKTIKPFTLPGDPTNYHPQNTTQFSQQLNKYLNVNGQNLPTQLSNLQQQRENLNSSGQGFGLKLAVGAAIGGGMLSTAYQNNHPNLARGFEKGFGDLELAGQAKMFLPGKAGTVAAYGLAAQGLGDFVHELASGTANQERDFAKQQETVQKVNSSLDALIQSISNLDQMTLDSSVSFEALTREQRKYQEALNQFQGSGAKFEQIQNIRNAPNSKSRMRAIEELRESYNDQLENQALGLNLNQANAKRGGLFGLGKKSLFGYSNEAEGEQQKSFINDNASLALANMSPTEKDKFEKEVMNRGTNSKLGVNNIYGEKNSYLRSFFREQPLETQSTMVEQMKFLATQSAVEKNPQVRQARLEAINQNQAIGLPLDMATRQEEMLKRLFINSTAMNVNNTIQKSLVGQNIGFAGESIGLSARQGMAGILGLTTGQKTNIGFQEESEKMRVDLETRKKLTNSNAGFSSKLVGGYTQNAEEWIKQNLSQTSINPGEKTFSISDTVKTFTESINKGLTSTISQNNGNLSGFIGRNGQLNTDNLHESILKNSGLNQGSSQYNNLSAFLKSSTGSEEQLKEINAHVVENTNITMEGNQAVAEATIKASAALREYQIQMNSSILGGVSAFQHPAEGMGMIAHYMRSNALMGSGNSMVAGRGAIGALQWMKQNSGQDVVFNGIAQNGLYKETSSDDLTNKQSALGNIFLKGYYQNQQRMISRMNPNDPLTKEMQRNMQRQGYGIGRDALESAIHPERTVHSSEFSANNEINTFKNSLNSTIKPIMNFDTSLEGLAQRINDLHFNINTSGGLREQTQNAQATNNQNVQDLTHMLSSGGTMYPASNVMGQNTPFQNTASNIGGFNWGTIGTIAAIVGTSKFGRGLLSKGTNKIGLSEKLGAAKDFITKSRAPFWKMPKPMSRDFENVERDLTPMFRTEKINSSNRPYYNKESQGEFGFGLGGTAYEGYPPFKKSTSIGFSNQNISDAEYEKLVEQHLSGGKQLELPPAIYNKKINTASDLEKNFANITLNSTKTPINAFKKQNSTKGGFLRGFGGKFSNIAKSTGGTLFSLGLGGIAGSAISEAGGGNGLGGFVAGSFVENAIANAGNVGKVGAVGAAIGAGKLGWDTGMAINDRYIGTNDRKAQLAAYNNQTLLNESPYLARIQSLRGSISNVQYQEGITRSDKGLSQETKDRRINASENTITQLNASIDALKEEYAKAASQESQLQQGGTVQSKPVSITVEISFKDISNLPGILDQKVLNPIKSALSDAFSEIGDLRQQIGSSPNPARVTS